MKNFFKLIYVDKENCLQDLTEIMFENLTYRYTKSKGILGNILMDLGGQ